MSQLYVYPAFGGGSSTGTALTFAGFNASGILSSIPNWTFNGVSGDAIAGAGLQVNSLALKGATSGLLTISTAATTTSYPLVMPGAQGAANTFLQNDGAGNLSWAAGSGGGVTTVGAIDSQAPSANGGVISGANLYFQSASNTAPGLVNTSAQTFAGNKTFANVLSPTMTYLDGANTVAISAATGTTSYSLTLPIAQAGGAGYVLSNDGAGALSWVAPGGGGGVTTVGAYDSQAPAANGGVISGANLYFQSASATVPGMVSTAAQSFAGAKTFTSILSPAYAVTGSTSGQVNISASAITTTYPLVLPAAQGAASTFLQNDGSGNLSWVVPGASGVTTVGAYDSQAPAANGAVISGNNIYFQSATSTEPGMVNVAAQTFAGVKTFNSAPVLNSVTASLPLKVDAGKAIVSGAIDLATAEVTGVLPEIKGGTNQSTYATGDLLYASAANTLSKLAIGPSASVLTVVGTAPAWVPITTAIGSTTYEEKFVLNGTDITNGYVDLSFTADGVDANFNSVQFSTPESSIQEKGVAYTVSLTGGAGSRTRVTWIGDLAVGGISALQAGDVIMIYYATGSTGAGLPPQAGNAGKFLTTDGSNVSWGTTPMTNIVKYLLNGTDISNKGVVLPTVPQTPSLVVLNVISVGEQVYSVDFTINSNLTANRTLDWTGLGLDGFLVAGNRLTVIYN